MSAEMSVVRLSAIYTYQRKDMSLNSPVGTGVAKTPWAANSAATMACREIDRNFIADFLLSVECLVAVGLFESRTSPTSMLYIPQFRGIDQVLSV